MKSIKCYNELYELKQQLLSLDIFHRVERYRLKLPHLGNDENIRITRIINYNNRKSGYFIRNLFIGITLVAYFFTISSFPSLQWGEVIYLVTFSVAANITGTVLGLVYARWRMLRLIDQLLARTRFSVVN